MASRHATSRVLPQPIRLLLEDLARAGIDDWLDERSQDGASKHATRSSPVTALEATALEATAPNAADCHESLEPPEEPRMDRTSPSNGREAGAAPIQGAEYERPPLAAEAKAAALAEIAKQVQACRRCLELADHRTQTVFGVGNPNADLCFLGEAPGADEDRQGEPFVGRAGQLLTRIIEACHMTRDDVYILNVLKCRPPGNRNPLPLEMDNCFPFLIEQLEIIQPAFICCLGAVAARALLDTTQPIGKLRGRFHRFRASRVLATYHPAYLLRNPSAKRPVWEDMKMLMEAMGRPIE